MELPTWSATRWREWMLIPKTFLRYFMTLLICCCCLKMQLVVWTWWHSAKNFILSSTIMVDVENDGIWKVTTIIGDTPIFHFHHDYWEGRVFWSHPENSCLLQLLQVVSFHRHIVIGNGKDWIFVLERIPNDPKITRDPETNSKFAPGNGWLGIPIQYISFLGGFVCRFFGCISTVRFKENYRKILTNHPSSSNIQRCVSRLAQLWYTAPTLSSWELDSAKDSTRFLINSKAHKACWSA